MPRTLLPLLLVNFIGTLGYSILIPLLIFIVVDLGGNGIVYGLLGATYSFFQFIGAPVLGRWSDRIGRRPVLLLSQLGTLLAWVVFGIALSIPKTAVGTVGDVTVTLPLLLLFGARMLDGLTGGNVSVANAYLADVTADEDRQANFGRMAVAAALGFALGPAIGGLLGGTEWGYAPPVLAAIAVSALAAVLIYWRLPEPAKPATFESAPDTTLRKILGQEPSDAWERPAKKEHGLMALLSQPLLRRMLLLNFLLFVGFNLYYAAFPVHAQGALGWSTRELGGYFAVMSVAMMVVQGPVLGRLGGKVAPGMLFGVGVGVLATSFLLLTVANTAVLYGAAVLFALGNGLSWPAFQALLTSRVEPDQQGAVQGWSTSAGSAASIVGLIAGGAAYAAVGESMFVAVAALFGLVVALAGPILRPAPETLPIRREGDDQSGRFLAGEGESGFISWHLEDRELVIDRTHVDAALRGEQVGGRLVDAVAGYADENDLTIRAACSYARAVLETRPAAAS